MGLKNNLEIPNLWKVFENPSRKNQIIWTIIFILCGTNFLHDTVNRCHLLIRPTKSAFVKLRLVKKLDFPAVTICPGYRFRKSMKSEFTADKFGCDRGIKNCDWNFPWNFMTHTEDMIKSCQFKKQFNCFPGLEERGKWRRSFTSLGRCFTYDSGDSVNSGGDLNALEFTVDPMIWDKSEILDFSGIRVYIHDNDEVPLAEVNGINVYEGASAVFSLEVKKYRWVHDQVKNPCIDSVLMGNYTRSKCILNCIYESAIHNAMVRCKAPFMTTINLKSCQINKEIGALTNKFDSIVQNGTYWNWCTKKCPEICERMTYTPITASLGFTHSNESLVKVKIQFREMWLESISEIWDYNFEEFISDTGGSLNLFLGASFITVIQVVDYSFVKFFDKIARLTRTFLTWRKNKIAEEIVVKQSQNFVW